MDESKTVTNIINTVASGQCVFCTRCGAENESINKYCTACGNAIELPMEQNNSQTSAFAPAEEVQETPAFAPAEDAKEEPAFAPAEDAKEEPAFAPAEDAKEEPAFAPAEEAQETPAFASVEDVKEEPAFAPAEETNQTPAFAQVDKPAQKAEPETKSAEIITPKLVKEYVEPQSVFAQGLPDWSIEPPMVMVRRRR